MPDGRVVEITSAANPLVKRLRSLHAKKGRRDEGLFLAGGLKPARDAVEAGWRVGALVVERERLADEAVGALAARVKAGGGTVVAAGRAVLAKVSGKDNPQTVLAAVEPRTLPLANAMASGLWVALDRVRDPGNLGTIIRTADAAGLAGLVLVGETCDPFSPEAVRASMGSFFHVPLARGDETAFTARVGTSGTRLVGTHLAAARDYRAADYSEPCTLLMGNEREGLTQALADACDALVRLPMREGADSLNLAVSTGVMVYEARRGGW